MGGWKGGPMVREGNAWPWGGPRGGMTETYAKHANRYSGGREGGAQSVTAAIYSVHWVAIAVAIPGKVFDRFFEPFVQ